MRKNNNLEELHVKDGELRSRYIVLSHDAGSHVTYSYMYLGISTCRSKKDCKSLRKRWEIGDLDSLYRFSILFASNTRFKRVSDE